MEDAYWMGYDMAYDEDVKCPYEQGTIEWDCFWDGFEYGQ